MEQEEKIRLLKKFGLEYEENRDICKIGITGMLRTPVQLAGRMFGIDSFQKGIVGRPYIILLSYGAEIAYSIKTCDGWMTISEDAWHISMSGLTDNGVDDSLLESMVSCPCEELQKAAVSLISLEENGSQKQWLNDFWKIDRWCTALSATKLLSSLEKEFSRNIRKYYETQDYIFYLGDTEYIYEEEDCRHINNSLDTFGQQFEGSFKISREPEKVKEELFYDCGDREAVVERRNQRMMSLQIAKLQERLRKQAEELNEQAVKKQKVIEELKILKDSICCMEDEFGRQIRIYYLRELQQKVHQKVEEFDVKLQQLLMEGIDEEDNLEALSENIPSFLLEEWEAYLQGEFTTWLREEIDGLNKKLGTEFHEKIEELIKKGKDPDVEKILRKTMEHIYSIARADYWEEPGQSLDFLEAVPNNTQNNAGSGIMNHKALPVIFIAAGAIVGIAGALLPGLALAAIGMKSKISQKEEREAFRKELKAGGALQEKQALKYVKKELDAGFDGLKNTINQWVHIQFKKIADALQMYDNRLNAEKEETLEEAARLLEYEFTKEDDNGIS